MIHHYATSWARLFKSRLALTTAYVLCSLRLHAVKLKTEGETCKLKTSPKRYETQIKILTNPGLA